nr:PREDICTED: uncharacterized protein LOC108952272 isoform X2 [Musa acuminata subsp. malaccensis]
MGTLIANGEVAMSLSKGKAILGRKSHLHDRIIYDIFVVEFDHCRCLIFFANTGSFLSKHPCRCHGRIDCIIILTSPAKLQERPQRLCSDLSENHITESESLAGLQIKVHFGVLGYMEMKNLLLIASLPWKHWKNRQTNNLLLRLFRA